MNEQEWKEQLQKEEFSDIYVQNDAPGQFYPDHTHNKKTAHIILEGEMTLTSSKETKVLKAGERFDIEPGTIHSAKMGQQGCKYIVGE